MATSNNDIEMIDVSIQNRLQTPIEVEESEPRNPDAIVVIQPETQDDPDGPNNVDKDVEGIPLIAPGVIFEDEEPKEKKWFR